MELALRKNREKEVERGKKWWRRCNAFGKPGKYYPMIDVHIIESKTRKRNESQTAKKIIWNIPKKVSTMCTKTSLRAEDIYF